MPAPPESRPPRTRPRAGPPLESILEAVGATPGQTKQGHCSPLTCTGCCAGDVCMDGNTDAYFIEGSDIARYDAAAQAWKQQGNVIELSDAELALRNAEADRAKAGSIPGRRYSRGASSQGNAAVSRIFA